MCGHFDNLGYCLYYFVTPVMYTCRIRVGEIYEVC